MKNTIQNIFFACSLLLMIILSSGDANAQVPQLFNYQGIARDPGGNPLSNQQMTIKLSVLPTADATEAEYEETQQITTNEFGLYTLKIGNGNAVSGKMNTVKWETGNKYIRVAIDPSGGEHFIAAGTNQLLSVPYAIYADKAGSAANTGHDKTRTGTVSTAPAGTGTVNYLTKFTAANTIYNSQIFDNGTNIGIGTASPASKLHLLTTSGNVEHVRMQNTNASGFGKFLLHNDNPVNYATFTKYGSAFAGGYPGIAAQFPYANMLAFGNNLGPFMLANNGNVGIGIVTGGNTILKFNAQQGTGYIGIGGNAVPAANVHLNHSSTGDTLLITNATTGHAKTDGLQISNSGNAAYIINKENSTLSLGTNNVSRVNITAAGTTEFTGQIKIAGGSPGAGKVLTSDASGLASWTVAAGGGNISGSGITNYNARFINANTIGNGSMYDDGTFVGIGNTTPHAPLQFANTPANRKQVLYEVANNDHQFFGFGINSGLIRYQVGDVVNNHVFYAGVNSTTSNELMRIQGNGNVGIGTSTPGTKLEVAGQVKITGGSPGVGKVLTSDATGLATWTTPATGGVTGSGTVAYVPRFLTATSIGNGQIVDNGTNVGIGTATPTTKLEVIGQVKITGGAPGLGKVLTSDAVGLATWTTPAAGGITGSGTANYSPRFITATSIGNGAIFDNGTNVGIGTATPHAALQLGNVISPRKIVLYENNNNDANFYGFGLNSGILRYQIGATAASHVFSTGNGNGSTDELMRIQGNGNVGIGTDTANAALQFGNVASNRRIVLYENANNDHEFYGLGINSATLRYQVGTTTGKHIFYAGNGVGASVELMRIQGNGKVGIGTTTANGLLQFNSASINRKIVLSEILNNDHEFEGFGSNANVLRYQVGGNTRSHVFYAASGAASSVELMRIIGNGRVGIGTATPAGQFELSLDQGRKPSTSTWTITSDERLKNINGAYTKGLSEILKLNPVTYQYKNTSDRQFADQVLKTQNIGFSAQDVQKVFPEAVATDEDGYLNLNIHPILITYVNAIKELNAKSEAQQQLIESQQKLNEDLIRRLEALEKK